LTYFEILWHLLIQIYTLWERRLSWEQIRPYVFSFSTLTLRRTLCHLALCWQEANCTIYFCYMGFDDAYQVAMALGYLHVSSPSNNHDFCEAGWLFFHRVGLLKQYDDSSLKRNGMLNTCCMYLGIIVKIDISGLCIRRSLTRIYPTTKTEVSLSCHCYLSAIDAMWSDLSLHFGAIIFVLMKLA